MRTAGEAWSPRKCVAMMKQTWTSLRHVSILIVAIGLVPMAACGTESRVLFGRSGRAPLPSETTMPAAPPRDPEAYRGIRYRLVYQPGDSPSVESGGRPVPWLHSSVSAYRPVDGPAGPYFGYQEMFDGSRRMLWSFRLVEPPTPPQSPTPPPAPPAMVLTTAPPPAPGAAPGSAAAVAPPAAPPPPQAVGPAPLPLDPPRAVLDVVVLSDKNSRIQISCGVNPILIDGETGWRLNETTGRIDQADPASAVCPKDD